MMVTKCSPRPILEKCGLEGIDYQVDPYVGCEHYCQYCYALNSADTDWTAEIQIHEDIVGQLANELADIQPQTIYLGYKTDPYQPCEAEQRQTRKVLRLLLKKGFSASILTKSNLVLRDLDLLTGMERASVSTSVAFNDEAARGVFELNTLTTDDRIAALRELKEAGVGTAALLCPVIPFITNAPDLIEKLAPVTEKIWIYGLSILEPSERNWLNLVEILSREYADKAKKIEEVVFDRDHAYWEGLRMELKKMARADGLNLDIHL